MIRCLIATCNLIFLSAIAVGDSFCCSSVDRNSSVFCWGDRFGEGKFLPLAFLPTICGNFGCNNRHSSRLLRIFQEFLPSNSTTDTQHLCLHTSKQSQATECQTCAPSLQNRSPPPTPAAPAQSLPLPTALQALPSAAALDTLLVAWTPKTWTPEKRFIAGVIALAVAILSSLAAVYLCMCLCKTRQRSELRAEQPNETPSTHPFGEDTSESSECSSKGGAASLDEVISVEAHGGGGKGDGNGYADANGAGNGGTVQRLGSVREWFERPFRPALLRTVSEPTSIASSSDDSSSMSEPLLARSLPAVLRPVRGRSRFSAFLFGSSDNSSSSIETPPPASLPKTQTTHSSRSDLDLRDWGIHDNLHLEDFPTSIDEAPEIDDRIDAPAANFPTRPSIDEAPEIDDRIDASAASVAEAPELDERVDLEVAEAPEIHERIHLEADEIPEIDDHSPGSSVDDAPEIDGRIDLEDSPTTSVGEASEIRDWAPLKLQVSPR